MPRFLRYILSLSLCLVGSQLYAQKALTELYGEGVHRYFAGDSFQADQMLSRVIESGVEDPLVYYFRGLARELQGGGGDFDFEEGARIEAAGKRSLGLRSGVGDALARIQGHTRVKIEKARRDARVAAEQQALLMQRAREAAGDLAPPTIVPERVPMVPPADATDPFGEPSTGNTPAPAVATEPEVEPEVDTDAEPFADDPSVPGTDEFPAIEPPVDPADPFGSDSATPARDIRLVPTLQLPPGTIRLVPTLQLPPLPIPLVPTLQLPPLPIPLVPILQLPPRPIHLVPTASPLVTPPTPILDFQIRSKTKAFWQRWAAKLEPMISSRGRRNRHVVASLCFSLAVASSAPAVKISSRSYRAANPVGQMARFRLDNAAGSPHFSCNDGLHV
jgi:hypothetical protein